MLKISKLTNCNDCFRPLIGSIIVWLYHCLHSKPRDEYESDQSRASIINYNDTEAIVFVLELSDYVNRLKTSLKSFRKKELNDRKKLRVQINYELDRKSELLILIKFLN